MDLTNIKTITGKTIKDFKIPVKFLVDTELVILVMQSKSMDDGERQYWFNLYDVMTAEQVEKLRDILKREKIRLAEIDKKYAKKPVEDPKVAAARAKKLGESRMQKQKSLQDKERDFQKKEEESENALLAELEEV
jgi:hypothetical protein